MMCTMEDCLFTFEGTAASTTQFRQIRRILMCEQLSRPRFRKQSHSCMKTLIVSKLSILLIKTGRAPEALASLDEALARSKSDPKSFSDYDDYVNWIYNDRALALTL